MRCARFSKVWPRLRPDAELIVKLHPLEQPDAFSDLPETERRVAVRVVRAYPPEHLIRAADVVLGMTSVLLLEAVLTGVPTISIRPGGGEDHFLSVHADKIVSVTDAKSLPEVLERALVREFRKLLAEAASANGRSNARSGGLRARPRPRGGRAMKPLEQPFIQGERCYLRPLTREDLDGNWGSWLNDPEVTRHMFRGAFPESEESNKAFYELVRNSPNDLVLAIAAADDDVHVGNVGLHRIDWVNRSAEFGILVGEKEYWSRGIGSEATEAIVRHGFDKLNLHRIWLGVFADHDGAIKVYERIGFKTEGRLREAILRDGDAQDQLIMGLLAHEFRGA